MLKGWLERTWLPGVSFTVPRAKGEKPGPGMTHIRWLGCITTSGSPWWWLQLFSMNNATDADRARFPARVDRTLGALI